MGKVMTKIVLSNPHDRQLAREGGMRPDQVRTITVEALVDTGATTLAIPANLAEALGLSEFTRRRVRMANGTVEELSVVSAVVEILGRECSCEAFVLPAGTTPLIGQVPLEILDLIVDPNSREVAVNPAHPDAPLLDLLRAS
jgi:clan AA aspartic protease